jgi:hypothetical protein
MCGELLVFAAHWFHAIYYNGVRTHRSLNKDAPVSRQVQRSGVINSRAITDDLPGLLDKLSLQAWPKIIADSVTGIPTAPCLLMGWSGRAPAQQSDYPMLQIEIYDATTKMRTP